LFKKEGEVEKKKKKKKGGGGEMGFYSQ